MLNFLRGHSRKTVVTGCTISDYILHFHCSIETTSRACKKLRLHSTLSLLNSNHQSRTCQHDNRLSTRIFSIVSLEIESLVTHGAEKQGPQMKGVVLNRVGLIGYFRFFFVLNRVRVSNPQCQSHTQTPGSSVLPP